MAAEKLHTSTGVARGEIPFGKVPSQAPNLSDQHLPLGYPQGMPLDGALGSIKAGL